MRVALGILVVGALMLPGCAGPAPTPREVRPADLGYDPATIHVEAVTRSALSFATADNVTLRGLIDVPATSQRTPSGAPRWPLVLMLHGWGGAKEDFTGQDAPGGPVTGTDRVRALAQQGFLVAAFDARGFGESGGRATVAGPAEQHDLSFLLDRLLAGFPASGRVGLLGASYGGGQALLGVVNDARVDAAVSMYGWGDLAHGLFPGNVPKLQWGQVLYGYGLPGSQGRYDPMIHQWYVDALARTDLDQVKSQMAARSSLDRLPATTTPILLCQGLQETLFPQADRIAAASGGFTRTHIYTGGHGKADAQCWQAAQDWFAFFLAGFDTHVDSWPVLDAMDANGADRAQYSSLSASWTTSYHLRDGILSDGPPSAATFTVEQSLLGSPLDAQALADELARPNPAWPTALRGDPSSLAFRTGLDRPALLRGAPSLQLHLAGNTTYPFQVTAQLLVEHAGSLRLLGRGAAAALAPSDTNGGHLRLDLDWTHARLAAGDALVLRLFANDPGAYYPLLADFHATFDGASTLTLPLDP